MATSSVTKVAGTYRALLASPSADRSSSVLEGRSPYLGTRVGLNLQQPKKISPKGLAQKAKPSVHQRLSVRAQSTATMTPQETKSSTKLPEVKSDFPEEKLIELTKNFLAKNNGLDDESILADNFIFAAPIIYLEKDKFVGALRSFQLKDAFPDLESNAYNFFLDPFEKNRVWFFTRTRGTHTGVLNFGSPVQPTNKRVEMPPEVSSLTFNSEGKATQLTAGYVADRRVGNSGGLGALFGILYAVGAAPPVPEFQPYKQSWQFWAFSNLQGLIGRFKRK